VLGKSLDFGYTGVLSFLVDARVIEKAQRELLTSRGLHTLNPLLNFGIDTLGGEECSEDTFVVRHTGGSFFQQSGGVRACWELVKENHVGREALDTLTTLACIFMDKCPNDITGTLML
jgi:hypothetical protein